MGSSAIVGAALLLSSTVPLHAQTTSDLSKDTGAIVSSSAVADVPQQKPKEVAAGEEPNKPDRGFAGTLLHNLGDDLKHIPRRNSLYWLGAGAAMSAAIHPAD